MHMLEFDQLIARVHGEFMEMPGLRLTIEQSARLWGLDRSECESVLGALVDRNFLSVNADGMYRRATDIMAFTLPLRAAKASPKPQPATGRSASTPAGRRVGGRSSNG